MLTGHVDAPFDRELKLLLGLEEDLDGLRVGAGRKGLLHHVLQPLQKALKESQGWAQAESGTNCHLID